MTQSQAYEARHYPIDPADPVEEIKFRIDRRSRYSGLLRRQPSRIAPSSLLGEKPIASDFHQAGQRARGLNKQAYGRMAGAQRGGKDFGVAHVLIDHANEIHAHPRVDALACTSGSLS